MKNSFGHVFVVLCLAAIAGCATCDTKCSKKVDALENRLNTLEGKIQSAQPTEAATITATAETIMPTSAAVLVTDAPTKKEIQSALKNAGFYTEKVDGKFGQKTKKAVEDFQKANGLTIDGKVGPDTWNKLKTYTTN